MDDEILHTKATRHVRVFECGRSNTVISDKGLEPRQGYIEPRWLGRLRNKQPKLHGARMSYFGCESQRDNCGCRRMCCNLKMEQLQQELAVCRGNGGTNHALIGASAIEIHVNLERRQG